MFGIITGLVCFYAGALSATRMGLTFEQTSAPIRKVVQATLAAVTKKPNQKDSE